MPAKTYPVRRSDGQIVTVTIPERDQDCAAEVPALRFAFQHSERARSLSAWVLEQGAYANRLRVTIMEKPARFGTPTISVEIDTLLTDNRSRAERTAAAMKRNPREIVALAYRIAAELELAAGENGHRFAVNALEAGAGRIAIEDTFHNEAELVIHRAAMIAACRKAGVR